MKIRILAFLLAVTLLAVGLTPVGAAEKGEDLSFVDVTAEDWFYEAVAFVSQRGLMGGIGENRFDPHGNMTRAMLVTVLWRYSGEILTGENEFTDIPAGQWYTEAVVWAAHNGIVNGTGSNLFDPEGNVTREQMAAIFHRYTQKLGLETAATAELSGYPDGGAVSPWAKTAMEWAVGIGLIGGTEENGVIRLDPQGNATRAQVATIFMRYVSFLEEQELPQVCWHLHTERRNAFPATCIQSGYSGDLWCLDCGVLVKEGEILPPGPHNYVNGVCTVCGEADISGDNVFYVGGHSYRTGMPLSELTATAGTPSDTFASITGYTWYVFGTEDYTEFLAAGIENDRVVSLCSAGPGFVYQGSKMGDAAPEVTAEQCAVNVFTDSNDGNKFHAVLLTDYSHWSAGNFDWGYYRNGTFTGETLAGESKLNFHLTNAFRVGHGVAPLQWCDLAAATARLHSQDMADQNYFSHTGLDGSDPGDRLSRQGVSWMSYGENIAAGYYGGLSAYDGWVNSSGHRSNMLRSGYARLGVGFAVNNSSTYYIYSTQNFYK